MKLLLDQNERISHFNRMVIVLFFSFILIYFVMDSLRLGIGPNPTHPRFFPLISKWFQEKEIPIYDLGSGFGFFSRRLAQAFPNRPVYSIEDALSPFCIAFFIHKLSPLPNLHLIKKNFLQIDLSKQACFYSYLFPKGMEKLEKKLLLEAVPHSLWISFTFASPHLKPLCSFQGKDRYRSWLYLYSIPHSMTYRLKPVDCFTA